MRKLWHGFANTILWSYERGSWPYDVMVVAIVMFVLLTPRSWFHDRQPSSSQSNSGITLIMRDPTMHIETYRVDGSLLPHSDPVKAADPQFEERAHEILSQSVDELKNQSFQIRRIQTVRDNDGAVLFYDVDVSH
ncbi:MAG TPA: hypothetical protein VGR81_10655 [Candidatus Acidoferrales bacterium]|nr:hypothetical protein [Candidatus Acidoferrales bacterium]